MRFSQSSDLGVCLNPTFGPFSYPHLFMFPERDSSCRADNNKLHVESLQMVGNRWQYSQRILDSYFSTSIAKLQHLQGRCFVALVCGGVSLTENVDDVFIFTLGFQGFEYPGPQIDLCPDA